MARPRRRSLSAPPSAEASKEAAADVHAREAKQAFDCGGLSPAAVQQSAPSTPDLEHALRSALGRAAEAECRTADVIRDADQQVTRSALAVDAVRASAAHAEHLLRQDLEAVQERADEAEAMLTEATAAHTQQLLEWQAEMQLRVNAVRGSSEAELARLREQVAAAERERDELAEQLRAGRAEQRPAEPSLVSGDDQLPAARAEAAELRRELRRLSADAAACLHRAEEAERAAGAAQRGEREELVARLARSQQRVIESCRMQELLEKEIDELRADAAKAACGPLPVMRTSSAQTDSVPHVESKCSSEAAALASLLQQCGQNAIERLTTIARDLRWNTQEVVLKAADTRRARDEASAAREKQRSREVEACEAAAEAASLRGGAAGSGEGSRRCART
eukprot:TRINITY_DN2197_c0_g2_i1.p1 TRINITY_DN2197_c0_g2~~TRINITY_DN2197_c0_g2_i1.p1  ORF type:complete len:408 (+),score=136.94 TRINITY_DN2197_c0_g2_i1:42-1226(+)